ncbi:conserved oligomeric Golgi complex component [Dispira parvispora]|uniref:Conserved oligomeric Golgi complex subunit 8 n=1 Tax=Dispira parvispora TaxID=1520584 RepID=A0A9W8AX07_9FUNG|nr:conserved oligomeric Golgi complex component [Dispira parvispora]
MLDVEKLPERLRAICQNSADETAAHDYLQHIAVLSLGTLRNEPTFLVAEQDDISQELVQLCLDESRVFQHAHHYLGEFEHVTKTMHARSAGVADSIPTVTNACQDFTKLAQEIGQQKRTTAAVQTYYDEIVDLLELPVIMRSCVKQGMYQQAIDLTMAVRKWDTTSGSDSVHSSDLGSSNVISDTPSVPSPRSSPTSREILALLTHTIEEEFEKLILVLCDELGESQLVHNLRTLSCGTGVTAPLSISKLERASSPSSGETNTRIEPTANATRQLLQKTRILDLLRRTRVFTELELRALVLRAKQHNWDTAVGILTALAPPDTNPFLFISRLLDLVREYLTEVVTQYTTMFATAPDIWSLRYTMDDTRQDEYLEGLSDIDSEELSSSDSEDESDKVTADKNCSATSSLTPLFSPTGVSSPGSNCPLLRDFLFRITQTVVERTTSSLAQLDDTTTIHSLLQQLHTMGAVLTRLGIDFRPLLLPPFATRIDELTD